MRTRPWSVGPNEAGIRRLLLSTINRHPVCLRDKWEEEEEGEEEEEEEGLSGNAHTVQREDAVCPVQGCKEEKEVEEEEEEEQFYTQPRENLSRSRRAPVLTETMETEDED